MRRPRSRLTRLACPTSSSPSNRMLPRTRAPAGSSPMSARSAWLLPAPDSPATPSVSPASISKLTSDTTHSSRPCRSWLTQSASTDSRGRSVDAVWMTADMHEIFDDRDRVAARRARGSGAAASARATLQVHVQARDRGGRDAGDAPGLPERVRAHGRELLSHLVREPAHLRVVEVGRDAQLLVPARAIDLLVLALDVARVLRLDLDLLGHAGVVDR